MNKQNQPTQPHRPPPGNAATVLRVSTIPNIEKEAPPAVPPPQHPTAPPQPTETQLSKRRRWPQHERPAHPAVWCLTACCTLFWVLFIAVGLAVLIIYLVYRPQPPRLGVDTATLNAGYLDEINGGSALNADLTLLATISNPNTKVGVILYRMELDLYFEGIMIATQGLWPAPLAELPGGSELRDVHMVASEVAMTREAVAEWRNATTKGGPVNLQLAGRFRTRLNFGRWLPYTYWVRPRCNLEVDPPPSGALLSAQC